MTVSTFNSPLGSIVLSSSLGKLVYCNWDHPSCRIKFEKVMKEIIRKDEKHDEDGELLAQAKKELEEYFTGKRKAFDLPLEFMSATPFQKKIWNLIYEIPYGETISYKGLAERYGNIKAVRAIARACGANPLAVVVPCHRVTGSREETGGYTGGLERKIRLQEIEQTFFEN